MLKKTIYILVANLVLSAVAEANDYLKISLKNNCAYPLKITVSQLDDAYNVDNNQQVSVDVPAGKTVENVATYSNPNIKVSDNKGGYMIVNLSDHWTVDGTWGHVGKIKGNDYSDLLRNDWNESTDGDVATAQATACSNTSISAIGLGDISVKQNGQDVFYRDINISNGTYQVFFSANPAMCTINNSSVNCDNSNIGYTKLGNDLLFICQHKTIQCLVR